MPPKSPVDRGFFVSGGLTASFDRPRQLGDYLGDLFAARRLPRPKVPQMPLTDATCKNARCPDGKARERFSNSGGLYLGFRSIASTMLHELGFRHDVIEIQLAHQERNAVSAAYNHATYLKERRQLMQTWADQLVSLRQSAKVLPFKAA